MQKKIIQDDGRIFIDLPDDGEDPCSNCGLCCSTFRISFYHGEMDCHPNGFVPSELTEKVNDTFACMKGTSCGGERCVAHKEVQPGVWRCSIYEKRPSPCREYPVWHDDGTPNERCQKLREKSGLPLLGKLGQAKVD